MKLSDLPKQLQDVLDVLVVDMSQLSWKTHDSMSHFSLSLTWQKTKCTKAEENPPSQSSSVGTSHPTKPTVVSRQSATPHTSSPSKSSVKPKRRKKPSRLRRDKKRLLAFREAKALSRLTPSEPTKPISGHVEESVPRTLDKKHPFVMTQYDKGEEVVSMLLYGGRIRKLHTGFDDIQTSEDAGVPPPVSVTVPLRTSVLELKEKVCDSICDRLDLSEEISTKNILLTHIAASMQSISSAPDPSRFTVNLPDHVPISTWALDKHRPSYCLVYDVILS